jgi:hypothetical protein
MQINLPPQPDTVSLGPVHFPCPLAHPRSLGTPTHHRTGLPSVSPLSLGMVTSQVWVGSAENPTREKI